MTRSKIPDPAMQDLTDLLSEQIRMNMRVLRAFQSLRNGKSLEDSEYDEMADHIATMLQKLMQLIRHGIETDDGG